jgi:hypothetical protein
VALFVPDYVREIFRPSTTQHGGDDETRQLRYLEWTHEPTPGETACWVDFAYMLKEGEGPVRVLHDRHRFGLFARADWLQLLSEVGFRARIITDSYERELFVGIKPTV